MNGHSLLLEDVESLGKPDEKAQNIKLIILGLQQRIQELEKENFDPQEFPDEVPSKIPEIKISSLALPTPKNEMSLHTPRTPREAVGIRGIVTKHEMALNNMNLRIADVEAGLQKLEPNAVKAIIKEISGVLIGEEKKGVNQEMTTIKVSQKLNTQIVEVLKDEIKAMDEKLHKGIENKIEKRDLLLAKNQLRRRVKLL